MQLSPIEKEIRKLTGQWPSYGSYKDINKYMVVDIKDMSIDIRKQLKKLLEDYSYFENSIDPFELEPMEYTAFNMHVDFTFWGALIVKTTICNLEDPNCCHLNISRIYLDDRVDTKPA